MDNCPNCNTSVSSKVFARTKLLSKIETKLINSIDSTNIEGFCSKCKPDTAQYYKAAQIEIKKSQKEITKIINVIPVLTLHHPHDWNYSCIGMVSAQSSTGTGIVTEFTSSITDTFGLSSNRHNKKIKAGELNCSAQLKLQAFNMGANAIIGADIDYAEIGSGKGILMICMSGTAVSVKNTEVLPSDLITKLKQLPILEEKIKTLSPLLQNQI